MGDLIEIVTSARINPDCFYKMSSRGFNFEIMADTGAVIGITKTPGIVMDIWVVIGNGGISWIKTKYGTGKDVETPDILDSNEYKRFWLSLENRSIQLGQYDDRIPILSYDSDVTDSYSTDRFCYVTFAATSVDRRHIDTTTVHWRFELPPIITENPKLKPIAGADLKWVNASSENRVPDGALIGGFENEDVYIIRIHRYHDFIPGKYLPSKKMGYVTTDGSTLERDEFQILCGFDCKWVPNSDDIPFNAVVAGQTDDELLYIGRTFVKGHLIPGKVTATDRRCYVTHEGEESSTRIFEILVHADSGTQCDKRLLTRSVNVDLRNPLGNILPEDDNDTNYGDNHKSFNIMLESDALFRLS